MTSPPTAPSPPPPSANFWVLPDRKPAPARPTPGQLALAAWKKAAATTGVPAASAACAAFAKRTPARDAPKDVATAVAESDPAKLDANLAALESDDEKKAPGRIRALRADLAPLECADAIVDPWLAKRVDVTDAYGHVAIGLSLASKLARTARGAPRMPPGGDKAKVAEFVKGPLKKWVVEQATAIEALGAGAAGLVGYGRGIAAIEAGNADLRLVDDIRSAPVPKEWDPELRQVYEIALDEALEPRKARGRDAALVGLLDFGELGGLHDARVDRTRAMLAKLYGGRRIDALDALWVPSQSGSGKESAYSPLPPGLIDKTPNRPFWGPLVGKLDRSAPPSSTASTFARTGYALERLEVGSTYWRRADFIDAAYAVNPDEAPESRFVLALALALARAHVGSAAEMMRAPDAGALGLWHTEPLDEIARSGGPYAGMAAYDAAYLRSLSPAGGDPAAWMRDVAKRFHDAEALLGDAGQKKQAAARAHDAEEAANATAATKK